MKDNNKIKQFEYRAKQAEAELNAVKSSKSYRISKILGSIKNDITSDPVGLTKKAARILLKEPEKLTHIIRSGKNRAIIQQSVVDQTNKYQEWILLNEPDDDDLDKQRQQSEIFTYKPLFSIVTPVYNPPLKVLEELIESVLDQTYPHFELYLSDDYGSNQEVIDLIEQYTKEDVRVKFLAFDKNRGIAGASNRILENVNGEYIALLDHDDTLSLDALYENAKLLNEKLYDTIYSDKDKIDIDGNRFDPLFKPQYSPEMMLNINYLTHLNIMRTSIVKKVGGWDTTTDGAQDWDLFLRVVGASKLIGHIPKILYHWRVIASSTALSIETKPYALASQRKAVDKYLISQKVPAESYHRKTELFIDWSDSVIDWPVTVFIHFSNISHTLGTIRHIGKLTKNSQYVILVDDSLSSQVESIKQRIGKPVILGNTELKNKELVAHIKSIRSGKVLFILDSIKLPKTQWYKDLAGWLTIPDVAAVGGRLINKDRLIVDSGAVVSSDSKYQPLFNGFPCFYQSYIGNAEWVRNLSLLSSRFFITDVDLLKEFISKHKSLGGFDVYFLWLTQESKKRIVMTPHVTGQVPDGILDKPHIIDSYDNSIKDIYRSPNVSNNDPLRLFDDEPLEDDPKNKENLYTPTDQYQSDAVILARSYDISESELNANMQSIKAFRSVDAKSVCWVLPSFDAIYAGLMNIFTFAEYLSVKEGLAVTFYILKAGDDVESEKSLVIEKLPTLKHASFKAITEQTLITKHFDIGIATLWSTAFVLAKSNNIKRKCYFIQDNEVNFYPKGSVSALVAMSYRFGFFAIANTKGLLDYYEEQYGGHGTVLTSKVDLSKYHPSKNLYKVPNRPYKVFFYARPNMPRNAFELGIAALSKLKAEFGNDVEIITAGALWNPEAYGVEGQFTNLGKIAYESVPKLYRSVDVGLMFMFSGHPGVTASELMASGCPVVVNEYDDTTWNELYVDEETCLVSLPLASEVSRNLKRCLVDSELRRKLIDGGLAKSTAFYSGYEKSLADTYKAITGN